VTAFGTLNFDSHMGCVCCSWL